MTESPIYYKGFVILPLTKELAAQHAPALLSFLSDMHNESWTTENLLMELPEKWNLSRIVMKDGEPVGFFIMSRKADSVHGHFMAMREDCRGEGIGNRLYVEWIKAGKESGVLRLTAKYLETNMGPTGLLKRYGFVPGERQPNGYIHMSLDLRNV